MFKKSFLILFCFILLFVSFIIPSYAVSPLLTSTTFKISDLYYSVNGGSFSSGSVSTNSYLVSNNYDSSSHTILVSFDLKDIGLLSGESYTWKFIVNNNAPSTSRLNMTVNISDSPLVDTSDSKMLYYAEDLISVRPQVVEFNFSVPAEYSTPRIFFMFTGANLSSNITISFTQATVTYINKADSGSWSPENDYTFPDIDESDTIEDFDQSWSELYDFMQNGYESVLTSVRSVAFVFTLVWNNLTDIVPTIPFLIVFSLLGGVFLYVLFGRH